MIDFCLGLELILRKILYDRISIYKYDRRLCEKDLTTTWDACLETACQEFILLDNQIFTYYSSRAPIFDQTNNDLDAGCWSKRIHRPREMAELI